MAWSSLTSPLVLANPLTPLLAVTAGLKWPAHQGVRLRAGQSWQAGRRSGAQVLTPFPDLLPESLALDFLCRLWVNPGTDNGYLFQYQLLILSSTVPTTSP